MSTEGRGESKMTCLYYKGELHAGRGGQVAKAEPSGQGGEVVNSELVGPVVRWYSTMVAVGNHSCMWPQDSFKRERCGS